MAYKKKVTPVCSEVTNSTVEDIFALMLKENVQLLKNKATINTLYTTSSFREMARFIADNKYESSDASIQEKARENKIGNYALFYFLFSFITLANLAIIVHGLLPKIIEIVRSF